MTSPSKGCGGPRRCGDSGGLVEPDQAQDALAGSTRNSQGVLSFPDAPESEAARCFRIASMCASAVGHLRGPSKVRAQRACLAWLRKALREAA